MPSNNSKYTPEFREETAKYIIESGKSGTSVAEDFGEDPGGVYRKQEAVRIPKNAEKPGKERNRAE